MDAPTADELLVNPIVKAALEAAWADSFPDDPSLRHEEGGWVYCDTTTGVISTRRAPPGRRNAVNLTHPPAVQRSVVVAAFHTHPNPTALGWNPEPSDDDRQLHADAGVPGLIVSDMGVYTVPPDRRTGGLSGSPGYPS